MSEDPAAPPPDALAGPVADLLARDEIRDLSHRYAVALDSRDLDALVALFVPDVAVGGGRTGREALRAFWDRTLRDVGVTVLQVSTQVVEVDGRDRAHGTVYCRAQVQQGGRQGEVWVEQAIAYFDDYERVDGRWLFRRRDHQLFYGVETAERPLDQEPARWPQRGTGVGTLPHAWDTWGAFWDEP